MLANFGISRAYCDQCGVDDGGGEHVPNVDTDSFSNWKDENGTSADAIIDCDILEQLASGINNTPPTDLIEE